MCLSKSLIDADALREPFTRLAADIKSRARGRRVFVLLNDGNLGDALIRYGTIRFLEDLGIDHSVIDAARRNGKFRALAEAAIGIGRHQRLFVYSGSGSWARTSNVAFKMVRRLSYLTNDIIVLPSTFEHFGLDPKITVYRRDDYQSRSAAPGAAFCHDMALYLALTKQNGLLPNRRPPVKRTGLMLRTDNEGAPGRPGSTSAANFDISASGTHNGDAREFLHYIDQFEHVITDRLHVGIGGVLLGKRVSLVTNSYFKNEAIYNSSIVGIFANAELIRSHDQLTQLLAAANIR